jgi:membrane protein YqaA with SNARE-associated domain
MQDEQKGLVSLIKGRRTGKGKSWAKQNQIFYNRWSGLAAGPGGAALVFGWAVAEATFWPVIPDFVLAPLAAVDRGKPYRLLLASGTGSAFGSLVLFGLTRRNPATARRLLAKLPLVHSYYFSQVEQKLERNRVQTLIMQPWSGVPAKIVVTVGAEKSLLAWSDLPVLMLSRTFRMAFVVVVSRLLGRILRRPLRSASLPVFFLYLLFFFPVWWQVVKDRSKAKNEPGK